MHRKCMLYCTINTHNNPTLFTRITHNHTAASRAARSASACVLLALATSRSLRCARLDVGLCGCSPSMAESMNVASVLVGMVGGAHWCSHGGWVKHDPQDNAPGSTATDRSKNTSYIGKAMSHNARSDAKICMWWLWWWMCSCVSKT